jgi:hypothetical protein
LAKIEGTDKGIEDWKETKMCFTVLGISVSIAGIMMIQ